jgi:hypothetical protein
MCIEETISLLRFRKLDSRNGFASGDEATVKWLSQVADEIQDLRSLNQTLQRSNDRLRSKRP